MQSTSAEQLQIILDIATEAALAAGAVLRDCWGKIESVEEKGRPGDLVTEVDKKSEAVILKILTRHFPDHPILAEESGRIGGDREQYLWAIDPLDGTTNYAHGYPASSVSIGLLIDNIPHIGVVYDPVRDRLYQAAKGLGATCNRRPIKVSSTTDLRHSLLVTGFAYDRHETTDNNYAEFCYLTHLTQGVRRGGSAALDLALVAGGHLDGYWERGLKPWDIVAGIVLVEEAGGRVTAYDESPFDLQSGRILATNSQIHSALSRSLLATPPISVWSNLAEMQKLT
ncbi:inositol monophosphatase family protein [Spirulina sp. 06S082]|uniref:inositol monophosphatase family protein n=1 Tax=Spirulina sp. 06S082 TaxID=3110248 RepID=UPI002B1EDB45|nr:inositol monophosphatase family protein [Spirulina sp. 06S082]MEA5467413.1 inositol monophosphatase family protein [Spirulina sp. 06S082]